MSNNAFGTIEPCEVRSGDGSVVRIGPLTAVISGAPANGRRLLAALRAAEQATGLNFETVAAALQDTVVATNPQGLGAVLDDEQPITFLFDQAHLRGSADLSGQGRGGWTTEVVPYGVMEITVGDEVGVLDPRIELVQGRVGGTGATLHLSADSTAAASSPAEPTLQPAESTEQPAASTEQPEEFAPQVTDSAQQSESARQSDSARQSVSGAAPVAAVAATAAVASTQMGHAPDDMADEAVSNEEAMPAEPVSSEPVSADALPQDELPVETMPVETMPVETMPVETLAVDQVVAVEADSTGATAVFSETIETDTELTDEVLARPRTGLDSPGWAGSANQPVDRTWRPEEDDFGAVPSTFPSAATDEVESATSTAFPPMPDAMPQASDVVPPMPGGAPLGEADGLNTGIPPMPDMPPPPPPPSPSDSIPAPTSEMPPMPPPPAPTEAQPWDMPPPSMGNDGGAFPSPRSAFGGSLPSTRDLPDLPSSSNLPSTGDLPDLPTSVPSAVPPIPDSLAGAVPPPPSVGDIPDKLTPPPIDTDLSNWVDPDGDSDRDD